MRAKRILVAIVVTFIMLLYLIPMSVQAAEEGTSSGSFDAEGTSPVVNSVVLYDTEATPATVTTMNPIVQYDVRVTVTDTNTLDDVDTVTVTIYYDSDGTYDTLDRPSSGDPQDCAILTWTNPSTWAIDAGGSSWWAINSGSCVAPTLSESTGTFQFIFTTGKVATETPGADEWHIYAVADDGTTGDNYQENLKMNWYGEIIVTGTANFGTVSLGTGFADNTNEVTNISVNYISNGAYDKQVKAGDWTGDPAGTATFDQTGACNNGNEFSLMAYISDTFGSAVQVTLAGATLDDTGLQTDESGDTEAANTLWLKVASVFTQATYTGSITYIIANGS